MGIISWACTFELLNAAQGELREAYWILYFR